MSDGAAPSLSLGAERVRRYRQRRRRGLLCVTIQVRQAEISALIQQALLEPSQRQHPAAVAVELLGEFRDVVDCGTPTVTRNGTPVTCHLPAIVPPLAANATTIPGFDNSSPSAWAH